MMGAMGKDIRDMVLAPMAAYIMRFRTKTVEGFSRLSARDYLRLFVIVCTYVVIVRPFVEGIGKHIQKRQLEQDRQRKQIKKKSKHEPNSSGQNQKTDPKQDEATSENLRLLEEDGERTRALFEDLSDSDLYEDSEEEREAEQQRWSAQIRKMKQDESSIDANGNANIVHSQIKKTDVAVTPQLPSSSKNIPTIECTAGVPNWGRTARVRQRIVMRNMIREARGRREAHLDGCDSSSDEDN